MFVREPIVLCLSLFSGCSDALIFTFLEGFQPVYKQWDFGTIAIGLAFIPIVIGYILAYFSFFPFIHRQRQTRRKHGSDVLQPEARLYWPLYMAPLETIRLFGFVWTSFGPPRVYWIAPMIFSGLIAAANVSKAKFPAPLCKLRQADHCLFSVFNQHGHNRLHDASYGPYSASATGGNGFARDYLAGIAAMYSTPFYDFFHDYPLEYPSTILACITFGVTIPIFG